LSRSSGVVDTLQSEVGLGGGSRAIGIDGSYIYWTPGDAGGVRRMALAGGAFSSFHAGVPFAPRVGAVSGGTMFGIDVDHANAFVGKVPTDGSAYDTLAVLGSSGSPDQFVDGGYLYWAKSLGIDRIAVGGGAIEHILTSTQNLSAGITLTGGYLYFNSMVVGLPGTMILRSQVPNGTTEIVTDACAAAQNIRAEGMASDGTYIYFTDAGNYGHGEGRVLRVKK
jgi:hypothetical protein